MPTTNNKNKSNASGSKNSNNKNSKSSGGVVNSTPSVKARDRAKDMDSKRRGDSETFGV